MDTKRIILALALSFLVFFGWQALFPPEPGQKTTDQPPAAESGQGQEAAAPAEPVTVVEEAEAMPAPADLTPQDLLRALEQAGGKKARAARLLGVSRSTFYRRMEEFGLDQTS